MVVINTFTTPVEGIVFQQADTCAFLNDKEIGKGIIYITESVVSWCDSSKHTGFSLQYPNISLHAARREPFPALYLMVDHAMVLPDVLIPREVVGVGAGDAADEGNGDGDDDIDEEAEEGQSYTELLFAPPQGDLVQRMYQAMSQCQALHPDQNDDPDSDIYEDASEIIDDDNFEPVQPMEEAEEGMQGLHLSGVNNGLHTSLTPDSNEGENMNYDPEQFADD